MMASLIGTYNPATKTPDYTLCLSISAEIAGGRSLGVLRDILSANGIPAAEHGQVLSQAVVVLRATTTNFGNSLLKIL